MRNRIIRGVILVLMAAVYSPLVAVPQNEEPLRFDSEVIRIHVEPDSLRIEGHYRFVVPQPRPGYQSLFYPYPTDSLLGGARTVSLEWRSGDQPWQAMDFHELPDGRGARWPVPLPAEGWVEVRTIYRQARLADYGRYIVTTTQELGALLAAGPLRDPPSGRGPTAHLQSSFHPRCRTRVGIVTCSKPTISFLIAISASPGSVSAAPGGVRPPAFDYKLSFISWRPRHVNCMTGSTRFQGGARR